jgi:hypothetical protein
MNKFIIIFIILSLILVILFQPINKEYNDILFVTAFIDIGRNKWIYSKRTIDDYFFWFHNLAKTIKYKLLVYIDDDIKEKLLLKYKFNDNIEFININKVNTFLDKYLSIEQSILDSYEFKKKIPENRLAIRPETWNGKYNLLNHSKVDFIKYSKKLYPNYKFYAWVDFGYTRQLPEKTPQNLNINKIPNKIIYETFYLPNFRLTDEEILKLDKTIIKGSGFIIPNNLVETYHNKYENKLKKWYSNKNCDDDESLVLQLYFDNPEMFHFIVDKNWFSLFNYFKKDLI